MQYFNSEVLLGKWYVRLIFPLENNGVGDKHFWELVGQLLKHQSAELAPSGRDALGAHRDPIVSYCFQGQPAAGKQSLQP